MNDSQITNIDGSTLEILLELKRAIMKQLRVCSFALVKSVDEIKKTAKVSPFPLLEGEQEKNIEAYCLNDIPKQNDIVLLLFADRNFINTLKRMKKHNYNITATNDDKLHSEDFAIIIQVLKEEEE